MKIIVIDLDGTLTIDDPEVAYEERLPRTDVIEKLRSFRSDGYRIIVNTARNMRTHAGNIGVINVQTLPVILRWLELHEVPFDEVIVGKPWCGFDGFYVDDRAIRPDEFVELDPAQIRRLISST